MADDTLCVLLFPPFPPLILIDSRPKNTCTVQPCGEWIYSVSRARLAEHVLCSRSQQCRQFVPWRPTNSIIDGQTLSKWPQWVGQRYSDVFVAIFQKKFVFVHQRHSRQVFRPLECSPAARVTYSRSAWAERGNSCYWFKRGGGTKRDTGGGGGIIA